MKRNTTIIVALLLVQGMVLSAEGSGGTFWGGYGLPFGMETEFGQNSPSLSDFQMQGGFGYGVVDGAKIGGFGLAITPANGHTEGAGGFGGMVSGWQGSSGPLVFDATLLLGVGGFNANSPFGEFLSETGRNSGPVAGVLIQAHAEVGFLVFPWLNLALFGGVQMIADPAYSLSTGKAFLSLVNGISVSFGSF